MKTTKTRLMAFVALTTLSTQPHATGGELAARSSPASVPSSEIQGAESVASSKDVRISELERRVAELEGLTDAYKVKIAAIEKKLYPSARNTISKRSGSNAKR